MTASTPPGARRWPSPTVALGVAVIGAMTTIGGLALPWVTTGARRRNSFDLLAVLRRLDMEPSGIARVAVRLWPLLPLVFVVGTLALLSGRRILGVTVVGIGTVVAVVTAVVVRSQGNGYVSIGVGPTVTIIGAVASLAGGLAVLLAGRRAPPPG